jgi:ribonuclease BN (tRNA processing enzyme)
VLVTEVTEVEEVIEVLKRSGTWQVRTPDEQAGWIRHMKEEHVTPEDIGKMATKAGVKSVVLTHLSPTIDAEDDYKRYADGVKKVYSGPVAVAKDLSKF